MKTLINITDSINKEKNNTSQNNSFNIHLKSQISFQEISLNSLEFDNHVLYLTIVLFQMFHFIFKNNVIKKSIFLYTNETYC